jgi:putative membrane-bound dehydrogenase-like protein
VLAAFPFLLAVHAEDPLPSVDRLKSSPVLRHLKPNPMPAPAKPGPEQTVAQMYLPEGFRAELVVGEPDLHQPVAFAFDERGRIWVAEAYSYPTKRPEGQGLDKIVIFEDRDGDGKFETRKVFAEGLNLVSGFEIGYGGVWVGAAPELLFIPDRNHDDIPDGPPQVLLDGFGYQDTHECLNSFLWGPDGWLYGNQGVFNLAHIGKPGATDAQRVELRAGVWRYHPVRHEFEVFANGGSNPWGLDYDEQGQIFMTHCRSYWGGGCTTHVLQGGHFWNQANANYAPFIVADPPAGFPGFKNYLLASARYDHGAGGAGKPGSDAIFGGHSHVGTMIYLGDNWPDEFRGHLFTHNLGGHQMNQQVNLREGSGFNTVHAGRDQFFCSDPKYVAVDLQYGPDGAVYTIDWYDRQHCHNPNTESWDRSNGRLYRIQYDATYKPKKVDLSALSDAKLVGMLTGKNAWYGRTARRLLHERASGRAVEPEAVAGLEKLSESPTNPTLRLQALWATAVTGLFTDGVAHRTLNDPDEYVRAWGIQLCAEDRQISPELFKNDILRLATDDPSQLVRLYLASAAQRLPDAQAWALITTLARHGEDGGDRYLPLLIWQSLAPRMTGQPTLALAIADSTPLVQLADSIFWYAAALGGDSLNRVVARLGRVTGEEQRRLLAGVLLAMNSRSREPMPPDWKEAAPRLYASADARIVRMAEQLAAAFGDDSMFPRLRGTLADTSADKEARKHAFAVLSRAQDRAALPVFAGLLGDDAFRLAAIQLLGRFDAPEVSDALLKGFERFSPPERAAALGALTSRPAYALALLDGVAAGRIRRDQLTALQVRQLTELHNAEVDKRVAAAWGRIHQSPVEKRNQMAKIEKTFAEAPLWAFDGRAGREHFVKLCGQCHVHGKDGNRLGPELTGAGRNGIRYFLENIVDPNAVIGADFQMTTVDTKDGETISGLIIGETASTLTLRTTAAAVPIPKADIAKRSTSDSSIMPEGLLDSLTEREQIELLKFLTSN